MDASFSPDAVKNAEALVFSYIAQSLTKRPEPGQTNLVFIVGDSVF